MNSPLPSLPARLQVPGELAELLLTAAWEISRQGARAFRVPAKRGKTGRTLRPGPHTPLWNELRAQLRPHLTGYGRKVNLGRLLGLPRQRVHAFITRGDQMPDAERTLQLLAWLIAVQQARPPA